MAAGDVFVERWLDLRRVPEVMDDAGGQAAAIVEHAVTWVARRDGFEPSPVCLLRPLAEAMDQVAAAFEELGGLFAGQWQEVRDAVVVSTAELERADRAAAQDAARVHAQLSGAA